MRVHILAKELGVTSKAILEKCRAEGLELKNHMATLSAGLEATVREWFSEGAHETVEEKAERVDLKKVRKKTTRKRTTKKKAATKAKKDEEAEEAAEGAVATAVAEATPAEAKEVVQVAEAAVEVIAAPEAGPESAVEAGAPEGAAAVVEAPAEPAETAVVEAPVEPLTPEEGAPAPEAPSGEPVVVPPVVEEGVAPPEEEAGRLAAEAPSAEPDQAEQEEEKGRSPNQSRFRPRVRSSPHRLLLSSRGRRLFAWRPPNRSGGSDLDRVPLDRVPRDRAHRVAAVEGVGSHPQCRRSEGRLPGPQAPSAVGAETLAGHRGRSFAASQASIGSIPGGRQRVARRRNGSGNSGIGISSRERSV